jgi:hypothetical protein
MIAGSGEFGADVVCPVCQRQIVSIVGVWTEDGMERLLRVDFECICSAKFAHEYRGMGEIVRCTVKVLEGPRLVVE